MGRLSASEILSDVCIRLKAEAHVMDCFPEEACGLLLMNSDGSPAIRCSDNLANSCHAKDPQRYPFTAARAYVLDPMSIYQAYKDDQEIIAIFHSHVRVGAYLSTTDVKHALDPSGDAPLYPGVDQVVLNAQEGGVMGYKVFTWHTQTRTYIERT